MFSLHLINAFMVFRWFPDKSRFITLPAGTGSFFCLQKEQKVSAHFTNNSLVIMLL
jgi:hypothetical protein